MSKEEATALWDAAVDLLERNQSFIPKEASASPAFVRVVKTPPQGEIMDTCKQTFSVEQLTTEAAGSVVPGRGHMGRGATVRPVDKKPRPAPTFTHDLTKDTKASEGGIAWTP